MKLHHHHLFGISTLFLISTLSLVLCPYSKVEESFNLQASYDLYQNGVLPAVTRVLFGRDDGSVTDAEYDHLQYPGVVPRTFLGPLLLSVLSRCTMILLSPFASSSSSSDSFSESSFFFFFSEALSIDGLHRFYLLLFVLHAQYRLATSLNNRWNNTGAITPKRNSFRLGNYYLLITASQFHLPFYSSRLLPNTFALALVLHAYADWLFGRIVRSLSLLVFTAAIVRCDVALLLFVVGGSLLLRRKVSVLTCLVIGVTTGVVALVLTVPLDSVLWGRLLWPEGEVLWFNTVDNRSGEYGTLPWYWYGTSAVPKAMLVNLLLVPFGLLRRRRGGGNSSTFGNCDGLHVYFFPVVLFVMLYSILPHKEVRFIFVALPIFNCTAARGMEILHQWAQDLWHGTENDAANTATTVALSKKTDDRTHAPTKKTTKNSARRNRVAAVLLFLFGLGAITASACGSIVFLAVSRENYPGGRALALLTSVIKQRVANDRLEGMVHIHIDVASAMTGAMSKSSISRLMNICASDDSDGVSGLVSGSGSGRNSLCRVKKGGYEEENSGDVAMGVVDNDEGGSRYDYLLSEKKDVDGYNVLHVVSGHPRLDLRRLRIVTEDAIFVLERDGM